MFDRYIIMDDVEVADISDKLSAVGLAGPHAAQVLQNAGIDVSQLEPGQVVDLVWHDIGRVRGARHSSEYGRLRDLVRRRAR